MQQYDYVPVLGDISATRDGFEIIDYKIGSSAPFAFTHTREAAELIVRLLNAAGTTAGSATTN